MPKNNFAETIKKIQAAKSKGGRGIPPGILPADCKLEEWGEWVKIVAGTREDMFWTIGDLALYGQKKFGEDIWQYLGELSHSTIMSAQRVAEKFPPDDRHYDLPPSIYTDLARVVEPKKRRELAQEIHDRKSQGEQMSQEIVRDLIRPHTKQGEEESEADVMEGKLHAFAKKVSDMREKFAEKCDDKIVSVAAAKVLLIALRQFDKEIMARFPSVESDVPPALQTPALERKEKQERGKAKTKNVKTPVPADGTGE